MVMADLHLWGDGMRRDHVSPRPTVEIKAGIWGLSNSVIVG